MSRCCILILLPVVLVSYHYPEKVTALQVVAWLRYQRVAGIRRLNEDKRREWNVKRLMPLRIMFEWGSSD